MRRSGLFVLLVIALVATAALARAQIEQQPGLRDLEEQEKQQKEQQRQPRLTKMPALIHQIPPVYPEAARAERRQGTVVVRMTIDEEGYVSRVDVVQSAGADLDWAAMGAVANFVFEPAEVDDVPAPIQLDYRQSFVLKEEVKEVEVAPPPLVEEEVIPPEEVPPAEAEEPEAERAGPMNYMGLVRESGTKAPVPDAEIVVVVEDSEEYFSATTDKGGRFEMFGVPAGKHLVRITATNYEQSATVEEFKEKELLRAIYYLPRKTYNKFETIVRSTRIQKEVSRIALSREEVSQIPGTFGDPIRVVENLPGMARAPLLGGALLVRGASPEDTGVYLDGVSIPLLYHFLALTSVVNAEFLETIDFYPGGFGARFGRATGGIVEVKSRDLRLRRCRGTAKVDLIDSGFFFGCPVTLFGDEVDSDAPNWRRITFAAAGRRSYIDALLPLFMQIFLPAGTSGLTIAPVYWDYQGKIEYRPLAAHRLTLFAFGSDDTLRVISQGNVDENAVQIRSQQTFHRLVGNWEWRILPNLVNSFTPWAGVELSKIGGSGGQGISGSIDVGIRTAGFRNDLRYTLVEGLNLNWGLDTMFGQFDYDLDVPFSGEVGAFPRIFPRFVGERTHIGEAGTGQNWGAYVEAEIGPYAGIKIVPGFRFDLFELQDAHNYSATPRLAVRWEMFPGTTVKGAYGVYEMMSPYETRVGTLGNPDVRPERSRHHIVGIEHRVTPFILLDFQLFYNLKNELVVSSNRLKSAAGGVIELERYANDGIGNAYGAEILLRHDLSKNFFGWIAYTLMRAEAKNKPKQRWLLSSYDQTHILTMVAQYKLPWHLPFREWSRLGRLPRGLLWNSGWAILSGDWSIGGRFRVVSGNPDTPITSAAHDLDTDGFVGRTGGTNSTRLPTFHQLDIRVDYKIAFDNFLIDFYIDMINVYNRKNAEATIWDFRYRERAPLALLPFLPVIGMSAEF